MIGSSLQPLYDQTYFMKCFPSIPNMHNNMKGSVTRGLVFWLLSSYKGSFLTFHVSNMRIMCRDVSNGYRHLMYGYVSFGICGFSLTFVGIFSCWHIMTTIMQLWHPLIIKRCLYLNLISSKGYDTIHNSGIITLPSSI